VLREHGEVGEVIFINKRKKKVSLLQTTEENKVTKLTNLTRGFDYTRPSGKYRDRVRQRDAD